MCNCISDIESKILEHEKNAGYKKPAVAAKLTDKTWSNKTISTVEITLDGQKKPITSKMEHSFCPFCGEGYEEAND
ncbi:hypothetical protein OAE19_05115 [Porticoccaceae bacterium]|nr:hypothetical protein [Porticoccaceae bacterium]